MCPVCLTTAALIAGGVTSTGGIAATVMTKLGVKSAPNQQFKQQQPATTASRRTAMASSTLEAVQPNVVSHAEWVAARKEFLNKEKELTRLRDELSQQRRMLPWEKVEKRYEFDSPKGKVTLADMFDGRSQLVVYHFMFGPGWPQGCPSCSYSADHFDGPAIHLANRDVTLAVISRAPIAEIQAFKTRMGWKFPWVSSFGSDFNYDYHVSFTPEERASGKVYYNYTEGPFPSEEAPGISVFVKDAAGEVFHSYSSFARGTDALVGAYQFLDLVPKGRDEDGLAFTMAWVRHHDRYEAGGSVDSTLKPETLFAEYEKAKSSDGSCCSGEKHA